MFWVSVLTGQDLCAFGWDGVDACLTSEPDCCLILCKANKCQKLHRRSAARHAVLFPVLGTCMPELSLTEPAGDLKSALLRL